MTTPLIVGLPGNEALAKGVADCLNAEVGGLETRHFPDGESYLRFRTDPTGRPLLLVCTLDRPDPKFLPLVFAAAAGRDLGAASVGLVAPYLAYMRQDKRFHDGEAVTSTAFARLLSSEIDWLVTVDPHLHRHKVLDELYQIPNRVGHAAPLMADWIRSHVDRPVIIGPDIESEQWVAEVAERAGAPFRVLRKERHGDRDVTITVPDLGEVSDLTPVLVDDIISSGQTMLEAARQLKAQGLAAPACVAVHALFADGVHQALKNVAAAVATTNSVPHASNAIDLAPVLADLAQGLVRGREPSVEPMASRRPRNR
ncbi:ribose-phosphate pyrophosphokinase [Microvirga sp. Mcv34]|uniref:ribose-phosphate pyrophosphokinase n=1 Tax=Microvirga sp. Mcv34 TaxID=2926016 RepID=UPI0021C87F6B|nr:ribose-phosphate pyrophosphokinase [Microvirga sp. Mcv34]